jgi:hypothetical protein
VLWLIEVNVSEIEGLEFKEKLLKRYPIITIVILSILISYIIMLKIKNDKRRLGYMGECKYDLNNPPVFNECMKKRDVLLNSKPKTS